MGSKEGTFASRHIGPTDTNIREMLQELQLDSLEQLVDRAVPDSIRMNEELELAPACSEHGALVALGRIVSHNQVLRPMIGMGYHDCVTPSVIQRCIFENPGWYTQYTPYQAEIAQGRLEALVNFQTMIGDITALPLANSSLLDEATAAAEAMAMCRGITRGKRSAFFVSDQCHPQTIEVVKTRAEPIGIEVVVGSVASLSSYDELFGILLQYPATDGTITDYTKLIEQAHESGALVVMATDLMALTLLKPPGELGADIAIGSAQRFGVPLGAGGPHAAFLSTLEKHKRHVPGRIIGVSRDERGHTGYRLALQTREQHIRRDKATSNICTAQVLLAIMAGAYAVYHGPAGLRRIGERIHHLAGTLAEGLRRLGRRVSGPFFDTLRVELAQGEPDRLLQATKRRGYLLRSYADDALGIALDETTTLKEVRELLEVFASNTDVPLEKLERETKSEIPEVLRRTSEFLTHEVFNHYHAEHEMVRYLFRLQARDLSLTTSMIPLGSCTMKLNATSEMLPVSWPEIARMHPYAPPDQLRGYEALCNSLEHYLRSVTGFAAISLQPNAGSQGEYTGLLVIRAYHRDRGEAHRNICLIPTSAHGTNPASAVMAGMKVVAVACDKTGNIDLSDLEAKAKQHEKDLAALMVTYPSTHGVFEETITDVCRIVHEHGGQVYMDGANMNAMVGLCYPADFGADVCHLNLHKTFAIPHGGGGPGMGPIGVVEHLAPFLPGHPFATKTDLDRAIGPVAAAPYGSPSILPISWMYITMMGPDGLRLATQVAILNANYMAQRLRGHYEILYTGRNGCVAHEFIVDMRPFKKSANIEVEDIAKRLMDYGFHAPTMSFPVAGTMMIEPTESEPKAELDRFCDALISIREEIRAIEEGRMDRDNNPLKRSPHTAEVVAADDWDRPYSREQAAFPAPWTREHKFWPPVGRIDNAFGDRNLVCTCPTMESYL